jgi:bifunctional oligoribonuclease and PAP phosphatase NrnA
MSDLARQIAEILRREQRFLVLTHYRPDGDAVGSQLALAILLKNLGKQVTAWNDDDVPAKFRFLPHSELIRRPPATPQEFDVVIAVDVSTWQRAGVGTERIRGKKHFINIDHHVSNEKFADLNWIVPDAPASGQVVYQLLKAGGFPLTRDIATCLFAAISTDTGQFSYASTTAECLRTAAELVETSARSAGTSMKATRTPAFACSKKRWPISNSPTTTASPTRGSRATCSRSPARNARTPRA